MTRTILDIFGNVVGQARQPQHGESWVAQMQADRQYAQGWRDAAAGLPRDPSWSTHRELGWHHYRHPTCWLPASSPRRVA